MRQLTVRVPRGSGEKVLAAARDHGGANLAGMEATAEGKPFDLVLAHVPNAQVGPLLDALEGEPDLHVTLLPQGVITLRPPASEAPDQATDVDPRSPVEVFLGGLQSVGSWTAFLGYAVAAGIVVWVGLFTNTVYLLTAAMLIAPFAGPAMNAALATARGDATLLGRALGRYFAALAVTISVAGALSLVLGQHVATNMMVSTSTLSSVAVLLPIVAGAAGALNLCQSERSSLVSGAATGMLVAALLGATSWCRRDGSSYWRVGHGQVRWLRAAAPASRHQLLRCGGVPPFRTYPEGRALQPRPALGGARCLGQLRGGCRRPAHLAVLQPTRPAALDPGPARCG